MQVDNWVSGCWAKVDTGQSLSQAPTKVNVYRFTRQGLLGPNSRRPVPSFT